MQGGRRCIVAAWLIACVFLVACDHQSPSETVANTPRLVSLAPAITETVYALGAGDQLVARSDYCLWPEKVRILPRAGTSITPNFERIAQLDATRILTENSSSVPLDSLQALADVTALPWRSVEDVIAGVIALGDVLGKPTRARKLAQRMTETLSQEPEADAPQALMLLGMPDLESGPVWYVASDTLHGKALQAAGFRNAMPAPARTPQMDVERLIALDPEHIIILDGRESDVAGSTSDPLAALASLPMLHAVQHQQVHLVSGGRVMLPGPSVLDLVDQLHHLVPAS